MGSASGPALVFLHHFGGSSRTWGPVTDRLADRHRCVAPDLAGFGEAGPPATGYAMADYATDIGAFLGGLGLTDYVLVGHSMGGKIALALASRRPPGLRALALFAPSPPTPEPMEDSERQRLLSGHGLRAGAEETLRKIAARPLSSLLWEQSVEDIVRTSQGAWEAWLRHGSREDITAQTRRAALPALIAVGDADPVISAELVRRQVLPHLPQACLEAIPGAGHLSPLEAPQAVANLVEDLLDSLARA